MPIPATWSRTAQCQLTCRLKSGLRFSANAAAPSRPSGEAVNRSSADMARLLRPAWWSVSALKDCLRNRMAVGLLSAISAAHSLACLLYTSDAADDLTRVDL